jgi:hypothetical protein
MANIAPICLRLPEQVALRLFSIADLAATKITAANMETIATATRSSGKVKPNSSRPVVRDFNKGKASNDLELLSMK